MGNHRKARDGQATFPHLQTRALQALSTALVPPGQQWAGSVGGHVHRERRAVRLWHVQAKERPVPKRKTRIVFKDAKVRRWHLGQETNRGRAVSPADNVYNGQTRKR